MAVTIDEIEGLAGAEVFDAEGAFVGTVRGPHVVEGELVGLVVDLDESVAALPTIGRDAVEVSARFAERAGEDAIRLKVEVAALADALGREGP